MAKILNSLRFVTAVFVFVVVAIATPQAAVATGASQSSGSGTLVQLACAGGSGEPLLRISSTNVDFGGSVTFTWDSNRVQTIAINGATLNANNGSYDVDSITATTLFQIAVTGTDGSVCSGNVTVVCAPAPVIVPTCDSFAADEQTITRGESTVLRWETTDATIVNIDNSVGMNLPVDGHIVVSPTITTTYTLTAISSDGKEVTCTTTIVVETPVPDAPVCDSFSVSPTTIQEGQSATLTWSTSNASRVVIDNGVGEVSPTASVSVTPLQTTTYTLSVFDASNVERDQCQATVTVIPQGTPAPVCDFFRATPSTIMSGDTATLEWGTTNATAVSINNNIGNVSVDGSLTVSPTVTTTYLLTVEGADNTQVDCQTTVIVSEDTVPVCVAFTATPSALPVGGGTVNFAWDVENADTITISPTIGQVAATGTASLTVIQSTTYTLTATDADGDETTCLAPVAVADPVAFTCANNVSFSATDRSIRRGQNTTLNWNVTGADSVSITDLGTVSFTGSQTVSPNSDRTYTLTATRGSETINCPLPINVSTGGGGGSSSPRCDLDISDRRITRGESVTLRWDTSRAREIEIVDDRGRIIVTTEDKRGDDKEDLFDGSIRLTPTRDTEYTLTVERGSRDRECRVEVEVEDQQVLGIVRDQQPLVAGIALSQVPYTGFEAGPLMTLLFYVLLLAWALYIAYFLVLRNKNGQESQPAYVGGEGSGTETVTGTTQTDTQAMEMAAESRPDVFAGSTPAKSSVPNNLPVADAPVGYESYFAGANVTEEQVDQVVTDLENRAHAQHTLLSSDAVELFMRATNGEVDRNAMLDKIIVDAKSQYPLEDGWLVLNQSRMQSLCEECFSADKVAEVQIGEALPDGSGSLAEAIVTGNVVAAYEMIGQRPMVALANAAADLDSVVRHRKGDTSPISNLLMQETKKLSDEQLQKMITALTGAIDGTYSDEASAVKMAIMKAVKEVA